MASGTPRAYRNAIVSVGNTTRAVIRFTCVNCCNELEIANNDPRKHGSFFGSQARRRGWQTDGEAINKVLCPDCRKAPAYRTRRDAELDSVVMTALPAPLTIEGHAEEVVKEAAFMPKELTQDQRMQIRNLLDKHFDDKAGCYLVGDDGTAESDQSIGETVGIPWGEVTKIREAAYGKILIDPVVASLRSQLAGIEAEVAKIRHALDGYALLRKAKAS